MPTTAGSFIGLRTKGQLYVEHSHDGHGPPDEIELYALEPDGCRTAADPYQLESQHANPCYRDRLRQLRGRLEALRTCKGPGCS